MRLADGTATAIIAGVAFATGAYTSVAPDLPELRQAAAGAISARQHLLDADLLGAVLAAGTAIVVGLQAGTGAGLVVFLAWLAVAAWHHSVAAAPAVDDD